MNDLTEAARDARMTLGALASLEKGWVDGDAGRPISGEVISRGAHVVDAMVALGNVTRSVHPTEHGGVCFYWPHTENQLTIEVEASGACYIHTADMAGGRFQDETLPTDVDLTDRLATWLSSGGGV